MSSWVGFSSFHGFTSMASEGSRPMPIGRIGTLVSLRAALRDKRVAQAQVWQRHHVRVPGCAPASLQRRMACPETARQLRPRQTGVVLETFQAAWEVVGEDGGDSAVVGTLRRHHVTPALAGLGA